MAAALSTSHHVNTAGIRDFHNCPSTHYYPASCLQWGDDWQHIATGGALSGTHMTVEWIEHYKIWELLTRILEMCRGHKGPLMSKEKIPPGTESDGLPAVEDPAQQEN